MLNLLGKNRIHERFLEFRLIQFINFIFFQLQIILDNFGYHTREGFEFLLGFGFEFDGLIGFEDGIDF